jgi:hypothetical protein
MKFRLKADCTFDAPGIDLAMSFVVGHFVNRIAGDLEKEVLPNMRGEITLEPEDGE